MSKTLSLKNKESFESRPQMEVVKDDHISLLAPMPVILTSFLNSTAIKTYFTPPLDVLAHRIIKRSTDIIFSAVIIVVLLSWLIPIVALVIKLTSRGPVFFLQKRNKRNGEIFTCIKFRSMVVNADADILPAKKNDKRVTRVGKFLRKKYIDELPQFFNVLWGDMSVIGPRPHMISDNVKYEKNIDGYFFRHKVKPGITGLAQVLGYVGCAEDLQQMKDRVNMDIFYMRHWSFKLDMIILYRTIFKAL
jgi:lipopolysaccharide/colanic/teichoic acid biosynthesis glycosyltransferase